MFQPNANDLGMRGATTNYNGNRPNFQGGVNFPLPPQFPYAPGPLMLNPPPPWLGMATMIPPPLPPMPLLPNMQFRQQETRGMSTKTDNTQEKKQIEEYIITLLRGNKEQVQESTDAKEASGNSTTPREGDEDDQQSTQSNGDGSHGNDSSKRPKRKKIPQTLLPAPSQEYLDQLASDICTLHEDLRPKQGEFNRRIKLLKRLEKIVQDEWPNAKAQLKLFGSSANNFGLKGADMDICLVVDLRANKLSETGLVNRLGEILKKEEMKYVKTLSRARVPIVKFTDRMSRFSCDICINNRLALHNTRMISDYAKIDERAQQLGRIVKYWAKRREINQPYHGTLSSYAYILLVIHFLQCRNPPVLPCLQQVPPGETPRMIEVEGYNCYYEKNIDKFLGFGSANKESVGELFAGFIRTYAREFDWDNSVVSIRCGKYLTKVEKKWNMKVDLVTRDNYLVAIEDPFEITHNLGRVVAKENLKMIQYEFNRAYKLISEGQSLEVVCKQYECDEEVEI